MVTLSEIAEIHAGHAFRGAITPAQDAESCVIQIRDVDQQGGVDWAGLEHCILAGRKEPDWLRAGDIVFQARGRKNFAVCLTEVPFSKVVCTQHFFVIRVHDERFSPSFIAWQLNQVGAQRHFDLNTPNLNNRHITLATLSATPLVLADQAAQQQIHQLVTLAKREQLLFEALMKTRQQQMAAVASQILGEGAA